MTKQIRLSIIVVSWNTREFLRNCISSVLQHVHHDVSFELIVVDNASTDGSAEMVTNEFESVHLLKNQQNLGFVRAVNQAAACARGDYLLLLNSDTRLVDDELHKILAYMDEHSKVGVAAGVMLNDDNSFQAPYRRFPSIVGSVFAQTLRRAIGLRTPMLRRQRYGSLSPSEIHEVDWVMGAYLFLRSKLVERGCVFDEDLFMYFEDTLLCYRIKKAGYSVVYLPYAPVVHYRGRSAEQAAARAALNSFCSSVTYFEKLYGIEAATLYRTAVRLGWRACAVGFNMLALSSNRWTRAKADLFKFLLKEDAAR